MNPEDIKKFGLLRYVQPEKIDLGEYDNPKAGVIFPNGLIMVNSSASLEEQVKTILHEIIHMHPSFISYTGGIWQKVITRNEEYEEKIEELAIEVYRQRGEVVKFIIAQLEKARSLQPKHY
jgi:hypothetical protein